MTVAKSARKDRKVLFVIMPFRATPSRNAKQLTAFFHSILKQPIENADLKYSYAVRRSDDRFNISEQIIKDLYTSDVVICDLSGKEANPNVMYELGVRLAFSNNPVILIREAHKENQPIFDVSGFYTYPYDPLDYAPLCAHIIEKLRRLENEQEIYRSPVLSVLGDEIPLIAKLSKTRASELLAILDRQLLNTLAAFSSSIERFSGPRTKIHLSQTFQPPHPESLEDRLTFVAELERHHARLQNLNWRDYHVRLGNLPSIDFLMSTGYLHGLVNDDIEEAFMACLNHYHGRYVAGDWWWTSPTFGSVLYYAQENSLLGCMAVSLQGILRSSDITQAEPSIILFKHFYERFRHTLVDGNMHRAENVFPRIRLNLKLKRNRRPSRKTSKR